MEQWKDIKGYENLYQVSNNGNVRSLDRIDALGRLRKGRVLKLGYCLSYKQATLCKDGKSKTFLVHRLVADAFIPNPCGFTQVNHKDENPSNNCADNLEWCDSEYNANYGNRNKKVSAALINNPLICRPVAQCDSYGNELALFPSVSEAERATGIRNQHIVHVCHGQRKTAGGYHWKYV